MPAHPLQSTWVLWELKHIDGNDYSKALSSVCEFTTIEEFWKYWTYFPKPSDVFNDGQSKKSIDGRSIKAFALFKKGIEPTWEDPANAKGSQLTASKGFSLEILDAFWENMVFASIGEMMDEGDDICGCRVVDQTRGKGKVAYKLELWLKSADVVTGRKISAKLGEALSDGDKKIRPPEFEFLPTK